MSIPTTLFSLYQRVFDWAGGYAWIIQVFAVVFILLLCNLLVRWGLRRLFVKFSHTKNLWDDAVVQALQAPVALLVWILGLTVAAEIAYAETDIAIYKVITPARIIGVVSAIAWFLNGFIRRSETIIITHPDKSKRRLDLATVNAIGKLLRASILITAGLVILQTLGFSISGVLAFGGIGGIAVGFAARDLLANFLGGLMLYLDRPFSIGDWVRSSDREIEGIVEDIGWRLTRIRAFDMRPIYVPNGIFSTLTIVNVSRMTHRRIHIAIGLRYADADKIKPIIAAVQKMLTTHRQIDNNEICIANFDAFAPSALEFFIYAYTPVTAWVEYHQLKQEILLQVLETIAAHNAEIAFPTTTIDIPDPSAIATQPRGKEK